MNSGLTAKWFSVSFAVLLTFLVTRPARAGICPVVALATDCGVQINVTGQSTGVANAFSINLGPAGNGNPYDGQEDTLVGITNMTGATLNSITLTASVSADAFGFEGDGACTVQGSSAGFTCGPTGYEGPNMVFGAVTTSGSTQSMTITFTNGGLGAGMSTWFSLEGTPSTLSGSGGLVGGTGGGGSTPEPASLLLLGTGLLGIGAGLARQRH